MNNEEKQLKIVQQVRDGFKSRIEQIADELGDNPTQEEIEKGVERWMGCACGNCIGSVKKELRDRKRGGE